jgi:hypothetical protein
MTERICHRNAELRNGDIDWIDPESRARTRPPATRRSLRRPVVSIQRLADGYDGLQMLTTVRRCLRRLADGYDGPQMVTTARRCLRQPADAYDGPQMVTTARRSLRRSADGYDGPQMLTTARRSLRRPADAYDSPQMLTTARRKLTTPPELCAQNYVPGTSPPPHLPGQRVTFSGGPRTVGARLRAFSDIDRGARP